MKQTASTRYNKTLYHMRMPCMFHFYHLQFVCELKLCFADETCLTDALQLLMNFES